MNERPAKHPTPAQSFLLFRQQAGWAGRGEDGIETLLASYQVKPEHKREQKPLLTEGLTGAEIDTLDDAALAARLAAVQVVARAVPAHKLRIVRALQAGGAVVGMTGDGVNDVLAGCSSAISVNGHLQEPHLRAAQRILSSKR